MGNSSQKQNLNAYVHPRLGPIKRIQYENSQQYIEYCVGIQSQRLLQQWERDLKDLKQLGANQYLFLPIEYNFDKKAMCGTGGNINIKYQDFMFSLSPQITNRRQIKRPFRQQQVWYLLYNLASIGSIMQKKQVKIGDIRPQNILLNQDGQFKLICCYSWPCSPDNNQLIIEDPDAKVFLSPQECQFHSKKKGLAYPDNLDFASCDVFSMGLTVLQAGTLKDCYQSLYDRQNRQWHFNEYKLRDYFGIIQQRYSKQLSFIIQQMLKTTPQRRIKCSTILQALAPYKDQILNIQQFQINKQSLYNVIENQNKLRSQQAKKQKNSVATFMSNYSNSNNFNHNQVFYGQNLNSQFFSSQSNIGNNPTHVNHDTIKQNQQRVYQQNSAIQPRISMKNQTPKSPRAQNKMSMKAYSGNPVNSANNHVFSNLQYNSNNLNNSNNNPMIFSFQNHPNNRYSNYPVYQSTYINNLNNRNIMIQNQYRSAVYPINQLYPDGFNNSQTNSQQFQVRSAYHGQNLIQFNQNNNIGPYPLSSLTQRTSSQNRSYQRTCSLNSNQNGAPSSLTHLPA